MKKTMLFIGSVIILILSAVTFIFIPAMADGMGTETKKLNTNLVQNLLLQ